jgi:monovalent cation:H+ antiporter-2, CPA2 family
MGHIPHLDELALVVGVGVVVALILRRLQLPTVAGLVAAGALVGPYGLRLVANPDRIEALAEVGVVLLLFTIGLEFSLRRFRTIARLVLLGGSLQVGLTVLAVSGVYVALGGRAGSGVFLGFLFALSSTAIVLRALGDRGELDAPHGRLVVGVLIFQDLCVVPMMLLAPLLAGRTEGSPLLALALALGKALVVVALVLAAGQLVVPRFLGWVANARSRELFVLAILTVCSAIAWLTSKVSLSLALGAFVAGMVLADTEYAHRAMGEMLPVRDIFASLFFMSMGMLFDYRVLVESPSEVITLFLGFVLAKGFLATVAAMAMRFPARVAWLAGVALAQFGEFGFVLAAFGVQLGLLDAGESRQLLAAGALSMFITPLLVRVAPHLSAGERLLRPLERLIGARGIDEISVEHGKLRDHVIIGGHGTGGRLLGRALTEAGVPHLALDLDVERLRQARAANDRVYYGDVTSGEALRHAGIERARVLVLLMDDAEATRRAVAAARELAPNVAILVRSRGATDTDLLRGLGADNVVSERLESGLEMMARVMRRMSVPGNVIAAVVRRTRQETQESARRERLPRPRLHEVEEIADLKLEKFLVKADAHAVGRTIADINLRRQASALIVAIHRAGALLEHPNPHLPLEAGDLLFLAGSGGAIRRAVHLLEHGVLPDDTSTAIKLPGGPGKSA